MITDLTSALFYLKTQNEEDVDGQHEESGAEDVNPNISKKKNKKDKSKADKIEKEKSPKSKSANLNSEKDATGSVSLVPTERVIKKQAIRNTGGPRTGFYSGASMTFVMAVCCLCCCMYI